MAVPDREMPDKKAFCTARPKALQYVYCPRVISVYSKKIRIFTHYIFCYHQI